MLARPAVRKQCRAIRGAMSASERRDASLAICRRVRASQLYWSAQHIALFWPGAEEVDLRELLGSALRHGKRCYLPIMRPDRRMWFVRYRAGTVLLPNRYGIPEPDYSRRDSLPAELLDLVCVPLLGFDRHGARIGAGGGYYDRTFAFKNQQLHGKPRMVGVAYARQELDSIDTAVWDVPLSWVATEAELVDCR